jgi:hypothetical protein
VVEAVDRDRWVVPPLDGTERVLDEPRREFVGTPPGT